MPFSTNIAVLSIINIYTVSIFLSHKYTILLMKGRNISLPRCAPLPRTVSKFWKRKRKCCLVFRSSTKREALSRHSRATTAKKCTKKACVQSCCFKNLNVLVFCHSRCHGRRRILVRMPTGSHWLNI